LERLQIGTANEAVSSFSIALSCESHQNGETEMQFHISFMPDPTIGARFQSAVFEVTFFVPVCFLFCCRHVVDCSWVDCRGFYPAKKVKVLGAGITVLKVAGNPITKLFLAVLGRKIRSSIRGV
jgi:hypothetical protein